jgi:hypothetical protein
MHDFFAAESDGWHAPCDCPGPIAPAGQHLYYAAILVLGESTWAGWESMWLPVTLWKGDRPAWLRILKEENVSFLWPHLTSTCRIPGSGDIDERKFHCRR